MVFEEKHHMLWAYEAYEEKPNSQDECGVGERGRIIVCGLLPPLRRSPSLEEGGLGVSPVKAYGLAVDCI